MFDPRSPVGLLNNQIDAITREILSQEVLDNQSWLDLGCGLKPYSSSFDHAKYIGIEVQDGGAEEAMKNADLYFDGLNIPFGENQFDGILCTQVLEHAIDSELLVRECNRVLKPGGTLIVSVPFLYREHGQPYDFRRFTSYGLLRILEQQGFKVPTLIKCLSTFETLATLFACHISNTYGSKSKWAYRLTSYMIVAPTLILARLLSRNPRNDRDTYLVLIAIGKKDSTLAEDFN